MAGSDYHFNEKKIVSIPSVLAFEKVFIGSFGTNVTAP